MEFLRRILKQIRTQLIVLTFSQWLAISLLVVVLCMGVWWGARYAAEQEMAPLLDQAFTEPERARIIQKLDSWEEKYVVKGDRIMVPKARRSALIAKLAYAEALPQDTSVGWNSLLDNSDIWTPESVRENKELIVLQTMLARSIAQGWPEVEKAEVYINKGSKRTLSNIAPVASASVLVKMAPGHTPTAKLAASIAAFVSSANNRMKRENVKVIADGRLISVAAEGEEISSDYVAEKMKYEQMYCDKIAKALPVSNALIQVDAKPRISRTRKTEKKIAAEGDGTLVATTEETSSETSGNTVEPKQEPGVYANVTDTSAAGTSGSQTNTSEDTSRKATVIPGTTETIEEMGVGGITDLTATVMIPSAYFESIAKRELGKDKEPDAAAIKIVVERETPRLKQIVMRAIGLTSPANDDRVVVDTYLAMAPGREGAVGVGTAADGAATQANSKASSTFSGIASRYGKHIAVSALAFVSLFMVLMMVRKAAGPVEMNEDEATSIMAGKKPLEALSVEETNIADAQDGSGLLAGLELPEEAIRSQQMLDQIKDMVQESPEVAATLVSQWISQNS